MVYQFLFYSFPVLQGCWFLVYLSYHLFMIAKFHLSLASAYNVHLIPVNLQVRWTLPRVRMTPGIVSSVQGASTVTRLALLLLLRSVMLATTVHKVTLTVNWARTERLQRCPILATFVCNLLYRARFFTKLVNFLASTLCDRSCWAVIGYTKFLLLGWLRIAFWARVLIIIITNSFKYIT